MGMFSKSISSELNYKKRKYFWPKIENKNLYKEMYTDNLVAVGSEHLIFISLSR